jgi:hypothetical protein
MSARVDIVECGRTIAGDVVAFDIQWEGEPEGDVVWAAKVTSADQSETVELGYTRSAAGEQQYVESEGRRVTVDADADVSDGEVTVRFPASTVGVAIEWPAWCAVLTVDGEVVSEHVIPTG